MDNSYKPHLPTDTTYLKKVSITIPETEKSENIHFEYLTDVTDYLKLENPYSLSSLENLNTHELKMLLETLQNNILARKNDAILIQKLYQLWDYLSEKDEYETADLIFVFWWPSWEERASEAVRLYKSGYASKILFTWQKSSFMEDVDITEAEFYKDIAMKSWIPEKDIIMENYAINTPENVVKSVEVLRKMNFYPKNIIGITLNYHMKRAYFTFKAAYPWDLNLFCSPVDATGFEREKYFLDKKLLSYVFYEYMKLYWARLMKHF